MRGMATKFEWVDIPTKDGAFCRVLEWDDANGMGHSMTFGHQDGEPTACLISGKGVVVEAVAFVPREVLIEAICDGWGDNYGDYIWGKE